LKKYGLNEIKEPARANPLKIFLVQFTSPLVLLLIAAACLSLAVGYYRHTGYFDSVLILLIVFVSGLAGFFQNYKAEKAVEALKKIASPKARVLREGEEELIDSAAVVPEDLIILKGGDIIPADAAIIEGGLEVNESVLTGESRSVLKKEKDYIYSGTNVFSGRAIALVAVTGMKTEIGKIAARMETIEKENTVFQEHMKKFTGRLVYAVGLIIVVTFLIGFRKFGLVNAGLIALALAVAAIPEGLTAVLTLAMSLGAKGMVKQQALIRNISITESIGNIDIICTDK